MKILGSVSNLTRNGTRCPADQTADISNPVTARKCLNSAGQEIQVNGVAARCFENTSGVAAGNTPSLAGYDHCS